MIDSKFVLSIALIMGSFCFLMSNGRKNDCQRGDMDSNCTYTEQREFDYMLFVESWDGLFCADGCCVMPDTGASVRVGFSVHGMWPQYNDGSWPSCCTSDVTREMIDKTLEKNKEIREMLNVYWPAFKRCRFVRYETEKHGTCALSVYGATEQGLIDYWTAVVKLANKFDYQSALASAGIVPSNSTMYTTSQVRKVIGKHVGATVNIACQNGNIIDEVRICLKKPTNAQEMINPVIFDCPSQDTSCGDKVFLFALPDVPYGGGCKN